MGETRYETVCLLMHLKHREPEVFQAVLELLRRCVSNIDKKGCSPKRRQLH